MDNAVENGVSESRLLDLLMPLIDRKLSGKETGSCLFPIRNVTSAKKPTGDIEFEASKQRGAHEPS